MGVLGVDLDKLNLDDDNNFYEDDPETISHFKLHVNFSIKLAVYEELLR